MKYIFALMLTTASLTTYAQDRQLFKTHSKSILYYLDIHGEEGKVYDMGLFYDIAGIGSAIRNIDTVQQQADGSYSGRHSHILSEKGALYLVITRNKTRKLLLDTVSARAMNHDLNNAYHLGQYNDMSVRLNDAFPLNYFSFRGAFSTWNALPTGAREMEHQLFQERTDLRFKEIEDSVTVLHSAYVRRTDYILAHLKQMDYTALKDSLYLLAVGSQYYATVVTAVALQQPEYYLQLAEDNPHQRKELYFSVISNTTAANRIRHVQGHDEVKKTFMKERKNNQWFRVYALGMFAGTVTAVTYMVMKLL